MSTSQVRRGGRHSSTGSNEQKSHRPSQHISSVLTFAGGGLSLPIAERD